MGTSTGRRTKKRHEPETPKALIVTVCILAAILLVLISVFFLIPAIKVDGNGDGGGGNTLSDFFDPGAKSGNLPGKTQEEIQAELDKIVEEGMFNISIASIVTVEAGSDEALVRIENIAANHHHMKVTITLDEGSEILYESAGLAPGQYIEYAKLNRKLSAGEYKATALFTAFDTDDLSPVGQAAAKITIVVGS